MSAPVSSRSLSREAARPGHDPAMPTFGQILDSDGTVLLCLQHANPHTRTEEFSLRDPDGYYVTISALSSLEPRGHEAPA